MKIIWLAAVLLGAKLVWAQPDPFLKPPNGLPFPLISPAQAEKLVFETPLKLDLKDVTVAAALESLQLQSGVKLDLERVDYSERTLAKRVSVRVETRSFNRAFEAIMDAAKLQATLENDNYYDAKRVNFNASASSKLTGPQSAQGLFGARLSSLAVTLSKTVDLRQAKRPARRQSDVLNASLTLMPDLRWPLVGAPRSRLTRADDDQGRSLLRAAKQDDAIDIYTFYDDRFGRSRLDLKMSAPAPDAKTLAHLEGVVVYTLVTRTETWEVPDVLKQPAWKRVFQDGGQTFEMTITPRLGGQNDAPGVPPSTLRLAIEVLSNQGGPVYEIGPPMLSGAAIVAALKIVDANGVVLRAKGGGLDYGNNGELTTQATFSAAKTYHGNDDDQPKSLALPLKLTFDAPLGVAQTEAPFSFENVALP